MRMKRSSHLSWLRMMIAATKKAGAEWEEEETWPTLGMSCRSTRIKATT